MDGRRALLAQICRFAGFGRASLPEEVERVPDEVSNDGCGSVERGTPSGELIPTSRTLDLFGLPAVEPRGQGRPRHVPTAESRRRTIELRAEGLNQVQIARAIGITAPTLVRHYHRELGSTSQAWRKMKGATDGNA